MADITTKVSDDRETNIQFARELLDKALIDQQRGSHLALYLPDIRWEMVRLARRMLET